MKAAKMKESMGMFKRGYVIVISFILAVGIMGQSQGARVLAQTQEAARPREARTNPPAEVTVTLKEQFFNAFLDVIFTRLKAPSFPLSIAQAEPKKGGTVWQSPYTNHSRTGLKPGTCDSVVTLEREMDGVKTAVRFENGRVVAPLAFRGSYSVALIGCINFQGWADTVINLNFDRERQVLSARVTVMDIHLSNIPSLASGVVVGLVQNSIDRRINPVQILQAAQLSTRLSITGSGGALRLRATEIRPEVVPGALSLHIFYEFAPAD
jgi:hypothetical protein